MNAIKELRSTTKMSQAKFATYLGIPVANIQHWEQGVSTPPNYLVSLISRVMKSDGYINREMSPVEVDAVRQTQATLSLEGMFLSVQEVSEIGRMVKGELSREAFQNRIKEKYLNHEP